MTVISDALRTEVLYLDGNPDYIVPASATGFMQEAANEIDQLHDMLKWIVPRFINRMGPDESQEVRNAVISAIEMIREEGDEED